MDPGKLDRRIIIQSTTQTRDTDGGIINTWSTYATRWASIGFTTKRGESFEAGRKTSIYQVLFTLRRDSTTAAITTKMRISYDSKYWDIRAVSERADQYRKMYITIEAEHTGPDMIG